MYHMTGNVAGSLDTTQWGPTPMNTATTAQPVIITAGWKAIQTSNGWNYAYVIKTQNDGKDYAIGLWGRNRNELRKVIEEINERRKMIGNLGALVLA